MKDIEKATPEELIDYARDELGIVLTRNMKSGTMRQRIADACKEQGKSLPIPERVAPEIGKTGMVTINIQRTAEKGGGAPVFVGFQGRSFMIPRGKNIPVPAAIEEILHNAVKTVHEMPDADSPDSELQSRDVPAHPYQIIAGHEHIRRFQKAQAEAS